MSRKNKKDDNLDTQTTFADMNVEGLGWYDPVRKNGKTEQKAKRKASRKEYWQMVRGAFAAMLPAILIFLFSISAVAILLSLWLK